MVFARDFVLKCEEEFGEEEVVNVLDACHALMNHGVDKFKRPLKPTDIQESERLRKLVEAKRETYNELWRTIPQKEEGDEDMEKTKKEDVFPREPEENILYFIEKHAPKLPLWKRELIRIVRKVAQYFYPQAQTKVMNEGFATFSHYHIINQLHEEGYLDDGFMLEFIHSHSSVLWQPDYNSPYFSGLNPYTLGYNIFTDLKRICENPTQEDKLWFPNLVGKDWLEQWHYAMENFRDDSFILQYLSPKVIREMKLFLIADKSSAENYEIASIHNERGYRKIREMLSQQYVRDNYVPDIQVEKVDVYGSRRLYLTHRMFNEQRLETEEAKETISHIRYLWGFPVQLCSRNKLGINVEVYDSEKM
jgi:spore cortex formation protein SpoVR/YcgB (stage V sporulation)